MPQVSFLVLFVAFLNHSLIHGSTVISSAPIDSNRFPYTPVPVSPDHRRFRALSFFQVSHLYLPPNTSIMNYASLYLLSLPQRYPRTSPHRYRSLRLQSALSTVTEEIAVEVRPDWTLRMSMSTCIGSGSQRSDQSAMRIVTGSCRVPRLQPNTLFLGLAEEAHQIRKELGCLIAYLLHRSTISG